MKQFVCHNDIYTENISSQRWWMVQICLCIITALTWQKHKHVRLCSMCVYFEVHVSKNRRRTFLRRIEWTCKSFETFVSLVKIQRLLRIFSKCIYSCFFVICLRFSCPKNKQTESSRWFLIKWQKLEQYQVNIDEKSIFCDMFNMKI